MLFFPLSSRGFFSAKLHCSIIPLATCIRMLYVYMLMWALRMFSLIYSLLLTWLNRHLWQHLNLKPVVSCIALAHVELVIWIRPPHHERTTHLVKRPYQVTPPTHSQELQHSYRTSDTSINIYSVARTKSSILIVRGYICMYDKKEAIKYTPEDPHILHNSLGTPPYTRLQSLGSSFTCLHSFSTSTIPTSTASSFYHRWDMSRKLCHLTGNRHTNLSPFMVAILRLDSFRSTT